MTRQHSIYIFTKAIKDLQFILIIFKTNITQITSLYFQGIFTFYLLHFTHVPLYSKVCAIRTIKLKRTRPKF